MYLRHIQWFCNLLFELYKPSKKNTAIPQGLILIVIHRPLKVSSIEKLLGIFVRDFPHKHKPSSDDSG